ncbi:unnamed protein product [Microthlaspi erraticum]|uniref:Arabidopsis retrotransposon Orf1 C-terminal domain-containing protein n=1 Tax=Microthlaspi erraticum TaxID=1685480 RepID=A0A6D2KQ99_9BRAS|nr:unnamed protein product [Microthlaspi erraticum]
MEESDAEGYVYSEEESESERLREERRTKKRNDPISSESEQGEFEIGVNLVQEEGNGSPSEEGSDETESEEEGEEVNQLVEKPLESLRMWSFLKNMHLAKLLLLSHGIYKELTCEFLASMRYHMYEEEDRADLDQGLGWITFLAKGEKRMVTFRQLGILFGFNYGEGTKWNFKEKELQRVWATIADGVYSSSRSKAAQIRSPVLRYVHKALANTFFARKATGTINEGELKFLDMGIKPFSHAQAMARGSGEIDLTQGT